MPDSGTETRKLRDLLHYLQVVSRGSYSKLAKTVFVNVNVPVAFTYRKQGQYVVRGGDLS